MYTHYMFIHTEENCMIVYDGFSIMYNQYILGNTKLNCSKVYIFLFHC